MAYKEFGATIAPANTSETGFPIAMLPHIAGSRVTADLETIQPWQLLGEGSTLALQKAAAIGQIWYVTAGTSPGHYVLKSWTGTNPTWERLDKDLATEEFVNTKIEAIPSPMIFKGTIGTGGTVTTLPTATTSTGFTYKVIKDATYSGITAKVGDLLISNGAVWVPIPSGDDLVSVATDSTIGGIKSSGDLSVSSTGVPTVKSVNIVGSLPTTDNFDGRQVTYQGRSYIWNGGAWKCDTDTLGGLSSSFFKKGVGKGSYYKDVVNISYHGTVQEILIKTKIPFISSSQMPLIHLEGYAYGNASPIELRIAFYIYNSAFVSLGCTSTCPWNPDIKLFTYVDGSITYVGIALIKSIYFPQCTINYIDVWGSVSGVQARNYSENWTIEYNTVTTPSIVPPDNLTSVPYRPIANSITGNAATATDSDKLDGKHASDFADAEHNHDTYLGISAQASDSAKLDGKTASAFAQLDENDKIKASNLPDYLLGQVLYGGSINSSQVCTFSSLYKDKFNTTDATRSLADLIAPSHVGVYFIANGNFFLNGSIDVTVGDWVISDGLVWGKIDNTDAVASVNGYTGVINLTYGDLGTMPSATNTKVGGVKLGIVTEGLDANFLEGKLASDFAEDSQTINFNTSVEPTQSGFVTKTSTWVWQYLTQSINFLWLKLKGLFSAGSATTNNHYLPKIDDLNKKLVKSNISDDGTTPKYGSNTIWHSGNDGSGSGLDADLLDGKHASEFATAAHTHDYSSLDNLPAIYNANHDGVPSDDFDELYSYQNDVWLCSRSMCNAPLDDGGNNNASYNTSFDNCVVQQFGLKDTNTKVQVLYITTGNVTKLSMGYIFYRMQGDKWKRIATYSDIADLQTQIGNLTTSLNSKLDKMSETTVTPSGTSYANRYMATPVANKTLNINCPNLQNLYVHLNFLNSLDESIILVNNNGINGTINVTYDVNYKVAGMVPFFTVGSKWIISIYKGVLFFNQIN